MRCKDERMSTTKDLCVESTQITCPNRTLFFLSIKARHESQTTTYKVDAVQVHHRIVFYKGSL